MPGCSDASGERNLREFSQRQGREGSDHYKDGASNQSPANDKCSLSLNLNFTIKLKS